MRAILGLLVLGGLFGLAALYQDAYQDRLREERRLQYGKSAPDEQHLPAEGGWVNLVLGRASGAEPFAPAVEELPPEDDFVPVQPMPADGAARIQPVFAPDRTHVVESGEVLGRICQRYYGTARPKVVEAVARYNDLADPGAIRLGQVLLIPDLELLLDPGN